jgi:tRNA/tmRNA/rRNA uracil-C5-methylase (TrmA/RlmC/RlmD family)
MAIPRCPYFGRCGGCSSQHIDYPVQVENKSIMVARAIHFPETKAFFGEQYNYRNRMDFLFHPGGLGFREKGRWNSIVNIDRCDIADEKINELMQEIKRSFP